MEIRCEIPEATETYKLQHTQNWLCLELCITESSCSNHYACPCEILYKQLGARVHRICVSGTKTVY